MLLNVPDELDEDGKSSAQQGAVLDKKVVALDGVDQTVRTERGFLADDAS